MLNERCKDCVTIIPQSLNYMYNLLVEAFSKNDNFIMFVSYNFNFIMLIL